MTDQYRIHEDTKRLTDEHLRRLLFHRTDGGASEVRLPSVEGDLTIHTLHVGWAGEFDSSRPHDEPAFTTTIVAEGPGGSYSEGVTFESEEQFVVALTALSLSHGLGSADRLVISLLDAIARGRKLDVEPSPEPLPLWHERLDALPERVQTAVRIYSAERYAYGVVRGSEGVEQHEIDDARARCHTAWTELLDALGSTIEQIAHTSTPAMKIAEAGGSIVSTQRMRSASEWLNDWHTVTVEYNGRHRISRGETIDDALANAYDELLLWQRELGAALSR